MVFYKLFLSKLFKFTTEKKAKTNSPIIPTEKISDGIPSKSILIILPKPNPAIKRMFDIVAAFQYSVLKIPSIQSDAKARYNPIIALKIDGSFTEFISTLKKKFAKKPYTNAAGITIKVDSKRCKLDI